MNLIHTHSFWQSQLSLKAFLGLFFCFFSLGALEAQRSPLFVPDYLVDEIETWQLSPQTLETLHEVEEAGIVLQVRDEERARIFAPKPEEAFFPEKDPVYGTRLSLCTSHKARQRLAVQQLTLLLAKEKLTSNQVSELVLFIENDFFCEIEAGNVYLEKEITGLACDLEFDPPTGLYLIHLDKILGKGSSKNIYQSILYDPGQPLFVVRAQMNERRYTGNFASEIRMLEKLREVERAAHLITSTQEQIILTYYEGGSIWDSKQQKYSLKEKVSLAKDLFEALKEAHQLDIVHRDLCEWNMLLEPNRKSDLNDIKYRLVLADWGTSNVSFAQVPMSKRRDVYTAGAMLWGFFHDIGYQKFLYNKWYQIVDHGSPPERGTGLLLGEIRPELSRRKKLLDQRYEQQKLTLQERFERVLLHILHPTIEEGRDAAYWYSELERLLASS